jgi:hypothetical protein
MAAIEQMVEQDCALQGQGWHHVGESRAGRDCQQGEPSLTRTFSLAALLVAVLAGACDRTPAPMLDRSIERGTALPPPDLAAAPRR